MSNSNNKFIENLKTNRAVYITAVTLLVALAVIVAITAATNRSRGTTPDTTLPDVTTGRTPTTKVPDTTAKPDEGKTPSGTDTTAGGNSSLENPDGGSQSVSGQLPSFELPVEGTLIKQHDPTLQVFSNTMQDYRVHLGIDILCAAGAPVYAGADGVVSQVWEDVRYGYCVAVKHEGDAYSIYKNLAETLPLGVYEGAEVRQGQLIASVGESAMVELADEPHLHYEMTVGGLQVDPVAYFDEEAKATLKMDDGYEG